MYAAHIAIALCVIVIIGVGIYGLRELLWMRAYNAGFVDMSRRPTHVDYAADYAYRHYRFNRHRRAYILGARHAKGY